MHELSAVRTAIRQAGEEFERRRGQERAPVEGAKTDDREIIFLPDADVQPGDWLRGTVSDREFHVRDTDIQVANGRAVMLTASVESRARYEERAARAQPQAPVFNIESAPGSIIGTQHNAELTAIFDFRIIQAEIERRGGDDADELREMVSEIRVLLEESGELERGALSEFSGVMERHSWITGSIASALLGFATQLP